MTNEDIFKIALRQSGFDFGCDPEIFLKSENKIFISKKDDRARKYLPLPFRCDMVTYGSNIVAQVSPDLVETVENYINKYPSEHCFETPHIHVLDEMLKPYGLKVCFMAEYFLPDVSRMEVIPCKYETKLLNSEDFKELYTPEWSNALCEKRKELDVLGVGAYDNGKLIGLAGCSADCEDMYQIGIDVLPEYRKQGVASSLTSRLSSEILKLGKVPFYCAAWCNVKSVRNAFRCGFRPAWVELTAREIDFINDLNRV